MDDRDAACVNPERSSGPPPPHRHSASGSVAGYEDDSQSIRRLSFVDGSTLSRDAPLASGRLDTSPPPPPPCHAALQQQDWIINGLYITSPNSEVQTVPSINAAQGQNGLDGSRRGNETELLEGVPQSIEVEDAGDVNEC